jgi:hypothetical protein
VMVSGAAMHETSVAGSYHTTIAPGNTPGPIRGRRRAAEAAN